MVRWIPRPDLLQQDPERGRHNDAEAYDNTHLYLAEIPSPAERGELGLAPTYPPDLQQQARRGSYTLRPLLDGIRGIVDRVLTDAPVPQPNPDPGQGFNGSGVSQALSELGNTNILGSKQRRQSLAAANRYSNASCDDEQGRCDNMQAGNPAQTSIAVPAYLPQRMGSGAATFDRRWSSQRNAGGTQHEPLKWQLPESSRHLGEQRLGRSSDDALKTSNAQGVSAAQLPQQLSWTAQGAGSPQTLKARRRVAGKQPAAAAGKSRGSDVSGATAREQENDSKSAAATQPEADTMELSRSQAAKLNSSAVDQTKSLAEASSQPKRCAICASPPSLNLLLCVQRR